jgi:putative membrane protein
MKILSYLGLVVGLTVMAVLVFWQGVGEIVELLLSTGWTLFWLPVLWSPCLIPAALSWQCLFLPGHRPRFLTVLHAIWIGRAVNTLLPVASIGGELVKARLLTLWGSDGVHSAASVLLDKTVQVFALILWGVTGAALLVYLVADTSLAVPVLGGLGVLTLGVVGFLIVQRAGMFGFLVRQSARVLKGDYVTQLTKNAHAVDETVKQLYRAPAMFCWAVVLKFAGLVWQTSEVWIAAYVLGIPLSLPEAVMLKSLSSTLSDIAFVIPNSYGIQESAYIALGALLGQPPDVMLALSLATRLRELAIDLPGLFAWQHSEARSLLRG